MLTAASQKMAAAEVTDYMSPDVFNNLGMSQMVTVVQPTFNPALSRSSFLAADQTIVVASGFGGRASAIDVELPSVQSFYIQPSATQTATASRMWAQPPPTDAVQILSPRSFSSYDQLIGVTWNGGAAPLPGIESLHPTPEASTWLSMAGGLALLMWLRKFRPVSA